MRSFPLVGPPSGSGVYLIKNNTTGQVYVGASKDLYRRYGTWRGVFGSGLGASNAALDAAIKNTNPEDWEFHVFVECAPSELFKTEQQVLQKTLAAVGGKCLNHATATPTGVGGRVAGRKSVRLTTVRDENGLAMTYQQIAERCGVTWGTVKKKLAERRKKGVTELNITELL